MEEVMMHVDLSSAMALEISGDVLDVVNSTFLDCAACHYVGDRFVEILGKPLLPCSWKAHLVRTRSD